MTTPDIVVEHLQELDARQHHYSLLKSYYDGKPPLSFLSRESKEALKSFDRINSNVCRSVILAVQERLRIAGFKGTDVWDAFIRNNLDQRSIQVHRDALLFGAGFILAWPDASGRPTASIESPLSFAVQRDPITREVISGVKRVRTKTTTEVWLYQGDVIQHYRADSAGAGGAALNLVGEVDNPLGVPPIAVVGHEDCGSAIDDLLTLQCCLDKLLLDAMIASEAAGRPRRWVTGIEGKEQPKLDDDGNPVIDGDEMVMEVVSPFSETANKIMLAEPENARIGQLASTDLAGFESGVRLILSQVEMVSGLPPHYAGALSTAAQPSSADALRASEAALVARAEAKQLEYGTGWERAMQLLTALGNGGHPDDVPVRVQWSPADTRSQAQEADAVTKLFGAGLISASYALRMLGYTADEVADIQAARRDDMELGEDVKVAKYINAVTNYKPPPTAE